MPAPPISLSFTLVSTLKRTFAALVSRASWYTSLSSAIRLPSMTSWSG
jgi:hypothetical protein